MKIIEFKPDLLHPTQENEIGLDNDLLTKIFVEPNVKTYSLSFSTLESAIEFCINKLLSGGYQFDKEYESWMKVE